MSTWSEATLLQVARLVDEGRTVGQIGETVGLPYRSARRYVQLAENRLALPFVTVRRTTKEGA